MVSEISNFAITGYFNTEAPPEVAGSIVGLLYWYEGLAGWMQLPESPPEVPLGTAFHLAVQWLNQSAEAISGYVELAITKPDSTKVTLNDVLNQNNWAAPNNGWVAQFEPVVLDQVGTYTVKATLSSGGQVLDSVTFNLVAVAPVLNLGDALLIYSINGHTLREVGIDTDGLPYATLATPITMSKLEGVTIQFTYIGRRQTTFDYTGLLFHLWHQTPGDPSDFGPPGYRGRYPAPLDGMISPGFYAWTPSPWSGSASVNSLFGAGYYYPRAYDLRIAFGFEYWDQYMAGPTIAFFRIKNAILCTGSGSVP